MVDARRLKHNHEHHASGACACVRDPKLAKSHGHVHHSTQPAKDVNGTVNITANGAPPEHGAETEKSRGDALTQAQTHDPARPHDALTQAQTQDAARPRDPQPYD